MKIEIGIEIKMRMENNSQNRKYNNNNNNPLILFPPNRVLMVELTEKICQKPKLWLVCIKIRDIRAWITFDIPEIQYISVLTDNIEGSDRGIPTENNNNNRFKYPAHRNGLSMSRGGGGAVALR